MSKRLVQDLREVNYAMLRSKNALNSRLYMLVVKNFVSEHMFMKLVLGCIETTYRRVGCYGMLKKVSLLHLSNHSIEFGLSKNFLYCLLMIFYVMDNSRANARREGDGSGEQKHVPP